MAVWTCRFETQASIQVLQQPVMSGHSLIPNLKQQQDKNNSTNVIYFFISVTVDFEILQDSLSVRDPGQSPSPRAAGGWARRPPLGPGHSQTSGDRCARLEEVSIWKVTSLQKTKAPQMSKKVLIHPGQSSCSSSSQLD